MTEVTLKQIVEIELKRQKRSLSWLAIEVGMSIDGLRLSLLRESIKYADIVKVYEVLGVRAGLLFGETEAASVSHNNGVAESERTDCFAEDAA